jgi:hypothetical protein
MTLVEADIEKGLDVTVTQEVDDRGGRELLWSDQVLWDAVARNNLSSEVHLAACVLCPVRVPGRQCTGQRMMRLCRIGV